MLVASLLLLMLLIACVPFTEEINLPDIPPPLKDCAASSIPNIPGEPGTPLTKEQVAVSLSEQRASALSKDRCVKDSQAWYFDLRKNLSK